MKSVKKCKPDLPDEIERRKKQSEHFNRRLSDKTRTFAFAPVLPSLLAVTVESWLLITLIIFAAVVIVISLYYIYLLLREHKRAHRVVVEKIVQSGADDSAKSDMVQQDAVYGAPQQSFVTYIPPAEEAEEEKVEEEAQALPYKSEELDDDDEGATEVVTSESHFQPLYEGEPDESMMITDETGEVVEVLKGVDYETGMALVVRYNKSFTAKFIQMTDESKGYYTTLKNYILSYKKTRSRVSWKYDNIHFGREPIVKFAVRGKTLCLYMALNPDDYTDSKYKVERSDSKKFEDVPCLYRIKNPRRVRYAMELLAELAEKYGIERGEIPNKNYYLPYEHTGPLIGKELIREYLVQERYDDFLRKKQQPLITEDKDNTADEGELTAEERFPNKKF
jgi:hypothetical protein